MEVDAYHLQKSFRDDINEFQEHERQKRDNMRQFYNEGMMVEMARQEKKKYDKELDYLIAKKKEK